MIECTIPLHLTVRRQFDLCIGPTALDVWTFNRANDAFGRHDANNDRPRREFVVVACLLFLPLSFFLRL